ncbi:helix-turn-helix domain-containing protein [Flavobacteriaceae bacterium R38]|nr:helix-turn-helix domain-containing protein [Flavobacteriaceae bacterium R38]
MKKIPPVSFIFLFFLIFSLSLNASIKSRIQIDSLKSYSSDTLKNLSKTYRYSDVKKAKVYAEELFNRGKNNNNLSDLAWGYHQLGLINNVLGNYRKSIEQYNKGISISKSIHDSLLLIDLYLVKGTSYLFQKEYEKVLPNYDSALKVSKKLKNLPYIIISNDNIAYLKKEVGLFHEALEIEKENLKLARNLVFDNETTLANLILNLGETYLMLEENDSAIYYSKKALGESLLVDNIEGTSYIYKNLGLAYYNKEDYDRSIHNLEEAIAIIKPFGNQQLLSELHYYKGRSLYQLQMLDDAIASLKASKNILIQKDADHESSIILMDTYKLLAEVYKSNNNYKESGDYFEKYVALDQERDESRIKVIGDLHQNNLQDKDSTIATLASEQKDQEKKYSTFLIIAAVSFVIILSLLINFIRKSKKNKLAFQNLISSIENDKKTNPNPIKIDDAKAKTILNRLENLEHKEFFLDSNFSLATVAKKVKTNPTYLSKTINAHKHMKFQDYANELRINYAINRLREDKKFRSYSVQHIAKEIGYKSPNSFTKHFKNKTGIYPSFFISSLKAYN